MPIPRLAVCLVLVFVLPTSACWAGLYSPAERGEEKLDADYRIFRDTYLYFKNVINDKLDNPLRRKALLVAELAAALKADAMTEAALLDVSAYLVRLQKNFEAIELLNKGSAKYPENFLLRSNLGTAYFLASGSGDEDLMNRAIETLKDAYLSWPAKMDKLEPQQRAFIEKIGWKENEYVFHRKAEYYLLRLIQGRKFEAAKLKAVPGALKKRELEKKRGVDALFTEANGQPLRFVGPSGTYEPGKLAEAELEKLPDKSLDKAIRYVEQLLVWLPLDERLYWQLGELVNANGFPKDAQEIFDTLDKNNFATDEFKAHRKILQESFQKASVPPTKNPPPQPLSPAKPPETTGAESLEDRWRFFGVGLGVGVVLALFGVWQLRRFSRRRPHGVSV